MSINPYNVLGIAPHAETEAIAGAYKALVRKYHPDVAGADVHAGARIREITEAYAILSDPALRVAYDRANAPRPSSPPPPPPPPPTKPSPAQPPPPPAHSRTTITSLAGRLLARMVSRATHLVGTAFFMVFGALLVVLYLARVLFFGLAALYLVGGWLLKVDTLHNVAVFGALGAAAWIISALIIALPNVAGRTVGQLIRRVRA